MSAQSGPVSFIRYLEESEGRPILGINFPAL
jgi:hypothetical protein